MMLLPPAVWATTRSGILVVRGSEENHVQASVRTPSRRGGDRHPRSPPGRGPVPVTAVVLAVNWSRLTVGVATALLGALAVIVGVRIAVVLAARRWPSLRRLVHAARIPFRVLVVLLALNPALAVLRRHGADSAWMAGAATVARVLTITAVGWFMTTVALFVEDSGLRRYRTDTPDNRVARRMRTQTLIIRHLTVSAGVVITLGAVLFSFPQVRVVGASLLASAGVIGVVAGIAAQSVLANVFAGIQLAFNDAIRLDDAVIVEEESRPRRSRTGHARTPSCSVRSSSTSTGTSTPARCAVSWTSRWSTPSCGTGG